MTAPGNDPLFFALALSLFMSSAYALGRIHQWHKHGLERDDAYRRGYDLASLSILTTLTRQRPQLQPWRHEKLGRRSGPSGTIG
jgi:hypothetical protein